MCLRKQEFLCLTELGRRGIKTNLLPTKMVSVARSLRVMCMQGFNRD